MARTLSFLLAAGFLAATGCKTITEELPTTATAPPPQVPLVNVPLPVVVTPVQLPQPQSPAPAPNPNSPSPSSTPVPEGEGDGDGPDIPDNTNPVARVQAKVFFVECNGGPVPGADAPVGCRVHLDATPKDAGGRPTQAKGRPQWSYSDTSAVDVSGNSPFNPVLTVKKTGFLTASCTIDGVRSNDVSIRFVP
ncbi:MAG TPA: hypothetical protein VMV21_01460 [Vicinamibacteria bacterium]|nr:hypothetical protein [Vicinamibacteria bacterium]